MLINDELIMQSWKFEFIKFGIKKNTKYFSFLPLISRSRGTNFYRPRANGNDLKPPMKWANLELEISSIMNQELLIFQSNMVFS